MDLIYLVIALLGGPLFLVVVPWWIRLVAFLSLVVYYLVFRDIKPKLRPSGVLQQNGVLRSRDAAHVVTHVWGLGTVPEIFQRSVHLHAELPLLGSRQLLKTVQEVKEVMVKGEKQKKKIDIYHLSNYKFKSYKEVAEEVAKVGFGLRQLGLAPNDKVCIYANTRAEWQVTFQACLANKFPVVTVYATLGQDALVFGFNQTKVAHIVTEASLLGSLANTLPHVRPFSSVIYFPDPDGKAPDAAALKLFSEKDVRVVPYSEMVANSTAEAVPEKFVPKPSDLAVVMYTSGSTGEPKGVEVTHANLTAAVAGLVTFLDTLNPPIGKGDTFLAFLPLAHIFEMAAETLLIARGSVIGYGSVRSLTDDAARDSNGNPCGDISALRPTLVAAVPAILDRFRDKILSGTRKSPVIEALFKIAYYCKLRNHTEGVESPGWDQLVFNKIKAKFGGRLKYIVSGGAPLSVETQKLLDVALCPVIQGYGLTETCSSGSLRHPDDRSYGHVGGPIASCELKLVDVPEMNYLTTDDPPRGEVLIRGGPVTKGYFEKSKETQEVYVPDQDDGLLWFHTGDIATLLPHGAIQIIDRRKDLVKMVQGEYIALGKLESIYRNSRFVDNICVYANPHQNAPVAVVVPNEAALEELAKAKNLPIDMPSMCASPALASEVLKSMEEEAKKAKLNRFEYVQAVMLTPDVWTPQSGMLTEAMKLKRKPVVDKYKEKLEVLYK